MPPRDSLVKNLAAKAAQGRLRLYHWLRENYADLTFARTKLRSTWEDIAQAAAEADQKDALGKPPTAEAVRKAWKRLEQDLAREGGIPPRARSTVPTAAAPSQTSQVEASIQPAVQPGVSAPPQPDPPVQNEGGQSRFHRRPVSMRGVPAPNKDQK